MDTWAVGTDQASYRRVSRGAVDVATLKFLKSATVRFRQFVGFGLINGQQVFITGQLARIRFPIRGLFIGV